ncbi:MAG: sigma-70 family RNA polymerase sigma factor [Nitrososphaerales archaeon]
MANNTSQVTFEQSMIPYYNILFKYAKKLCGNIHTAEDLVQDTYIRAFAKFDTYCPARSSPLTWLRRIMLNRYYDIVRHRTPTENIVPDRLTSVHINELECESAIPNDIDFNYIIESIDTDRDRQIFRDYFLYGYSHKEIGHKLGLTRAAISHRINVILTHIRPLVVRMIGINI